MERHLTVWCCIMMENPSTCVRYDKYTFANWQCLKFCLCIGVFCAFGVDDIHSFSVEDRRRFEPLFWGDVLLLRSLYVSLLCVSFLYTDNTILVFDSEFGLIWLMFLCGTAHCPCFWCREWQGG